ncbi:MAG TPA: xanthine dehydrogenase family protein subunit M [Methylomirabilota bacterium]
MTLPAFDYREPETLAEVLALLREHGDEARLMGGGTALTLMLRARLVRPSVIVSLARLGALVGIRANGHLEIGAMTTHRAVERSPLVRALAPLLAEACERVGSPPIRNMGTLGGNLATGEAASDPAPALLALDARVRLRGPEGERVLALDGFFRDFYETALGPEEVIVAIEVPPVPAGARAAFVKYTCLSEEERAVVSVAALLAMGRDGTVVEARIGLGAVGPTPFRARAAETLLVGHRPTVARAAAAADAAAAGTAPLDDRQGSAEYRREMTRVWVLRLVEQLAAGTA